MIMTMSMSSIDIEAIRTVLFFLLKYFAQKKTHKLHSNILIHLKRHNKQHKQLSFRCKADVSSFRWTFCSNIDLKKYSWHKM